MQTTTTRQTHKTCAECKRSLPRATDFAVRMLDDPFGIAIGLKGKERAAVLAAGPPADRPLLVQPRCRECDRLRSQRKVAIRAIQRHWPDANVTLHDAGARRIVVNSKTSALTDICGAAAVAGLAVLDTKNNLLVPEDTDKALLCLYTLILTDKRVGDLGPDREDAIDRAREIAAKAPDDAHKRRKWADDVADVAFVREGLTRASAAYERIYARYQAHHAKIAWAVITKHNVDDQMVWGRYHEAFLHGIRKWDPRKEGALATYIGHWVPRYLDFIRTAADRPIGVRQERDGSWTSAYVSLDAAPISDGKDMIEQFAVPAHQAYGGASATANSDESDRCDTVSRDVRSAMKLLDAEDQDLAWRVLALGESPTAAARELGMTKLEVKTRMESITVVLRSRLAGAYQEQS